MDEKKGVGAELQSNAHCYITGKKTVISTPKMVYSQPRHISINTPKTF